jgi:hypothetical protein
MTASTGFAASWPGTAITAVTWNSGSTR